MTKATALRLTPPAGGNAAAQVSPPSVLRTTVLLGPSLSPTAITVFPFLASATRFLFVTPLSSTQLTPESAVRTIAPPAPTATPSEPLKATASRSAAAPPTVASLHTVPPLVL